MFHKQCCIFRFTYLKYFNTVPSATIGVGYFLIFKLPTESLHPSRLVTCLKALGTSIEMPSGNGSVHRAVSLVLVKVKALSRFGRADFIMCFCVQLRCSLRRS